MLSGVPRMKEISTATRTAKMKGVKVVLPLREGLLIAAGQRKVALAVVGKLVSSTTLRPAMPRNTTAQSHRDFVEQAFLAPMRGVAKSRFVDHRRTLERILVARSLNQRLPNSAAHAERVASLHADIDRFFVWSDEQLDLDDEGDDESPMAPVRTLHSLTNTWRTSEPSKMTSEARRGWTQDALDAFVRAHSVLIAGINKRNQKDTTVDMLCESVWRALLPVFGVDASFVVVPRIARRVLGDSDSVEEEEATAGKRRRIAHDMEVPLEFAVVGLDLTASYESKLYEHIRRNRHLIFIDLLEPADSDTAVNMSRMAQLDALHERPDFYVANVDGNADALREDELLKRKLAEIKVAQTRHLFKNLVSTRVLDIVDSFYIAYQPLSIDAATRDITVHFMKTPPTVDDDGVEQPSLTTPSYHERIAIEAYFFNDCFGAMGLGCQREECKAAREDSDHPRHADAMVGCLSAWMISFRLSLAWFERNSVTASAVKEAIEHALGPFFHVWIGDENSSDYIPMHVRVYRCQLAMALAETQKAVLMKLDYPGASECDDEMLVLERTKWTLLNYAFCGPLHGSAVMCEETMQQVFTNERGLEEVARTVLVSNSGDLYHMLGLRGIEASKVRSNSVHDMLEVLGVEAARATAISEYHGVMSEGGTFINRAHYALRADVQTRSGGFLPLTAAGLRSMPHDVCQSASHREQAKTVVQAAMHRRSIYPLTSPSANVVLALQLAHNGTGSVILQPDTQALLDNSCARAQPEPTAVLHAMSHETDSEEVQRWRKMNEAAKSTVPPAWSTPASPTHDEYDDNVTFSPPRAAPASTKAQSFEEFVSRAQPGAFSPIHASRMLVDEALPEPVLESPRHEDVDDEGDTDEDDALRESSSQAVNNLREIVEIDTDAIDAEAVQELGISEFGSHMWLKHTSKPAITLTQPYDPERPSIAALEYDPSLPSYINTAQPLRTSELDKLQKTLAALTADDNDDITDLFGTGIAPQVRMY